MSLALFLLTVASCAADGAQLCEDAAQLIAECTDSAPVIPSECTRDAAEAAQTILDLGCDGLDPSKADGLTQLCQPHLKKWFGLWPSFCEPEAVTCEASGDDLDASLCNGASELCDRPYNQVVYGTSHNAFNVATLEFFRPNQSYRMFVQLRDGMRALMLDTHLPDPSGELQLCHADCKNGQQSLLEGLSEVRAFLDCYPREVVTLLIEPTAGGDAHVAAFQAAGLAELAYSHRLGDPWPTLGELLDLGKRIVVFAEDCKGELCPEVENGPSWYHPMWQFAFDNEYHVEWTKDFDCALKRGNAHNDLFGLNHFITLEPFDKSLGGDAWAAHFANKRDSLMEHVNQCEEAIGRLPSFLTVDFYDSGAVLDIVGELNAR